MIFFNDLMKLIKILTNNFTRMFNRHQFVRFLLIGIGNTGFSYGLYAALLFLGLQYQVASLLALLLGIAFSFITQGNVVFRNATRYTFLKFVVAWMLIYVINILIIGLLMRLSMNAYLAGAVATMPVTLISYFILKFAVFGLVKSLRISKSIN